MQIYSAAFLCMATLIFSGLISITLAAKAYKIFNNRMEPFVKYFIFAMLSMSFWAFNYAIEIGSPRIELKYLFTCLKYVGIAFAPVTWFMFTVEYTGVTQKCIHRYEKALFFLPIFMILAVFTNNFHGLYFHSYYLDSSRGFPLIVFTYGPLFWIFYVYSFILIFLGFFFFIKQFAQLTLHYRVQAKILFISAFIPVFVNLLHVGKIGPFTFFDFTPLSFPITGLIVFWGIMEHEFLSILPVARENVIESMNDGYIVIDMSDYIVDINKAALELAGKTRKQVIGKKLNELFTTDNRIFSERLPDENFNMKISLKRDSETRFFTLSNTPLTTRKDTEGKLIMIHDITEICVYQEALKQANKKINLMSNIARYEIQSQVTVLSGCAEFLSGILQQNVKEEPRIRKYLQNLSKGIETISNQIVFTQDYQELGDAAPTWQSVSNTARESSKAFSAKGTKYLIEKSDLEIYADPLLKKAFYNLFDNAETHGKHVSEIRVSSRRIGEQVIIEIQDNGIGIPADMKTLIFEKSVGKNTGLGLFLVNRILSITGLTIKETGIEGKGARFEITVPKGYWKKSSQN